MRSWLGILKFTVLTNFSCQVFFLLSERLVSYKYDILISPTCMYMYTVWTNFFLMVSY